MKIYYSILRLFLKKTFSFWQALGFHITPNQFYELIPDTRELKLLSEFLKFKEEYEEFPRFKTSILYQYYVNNGSFELVNGEVLYCMIRYFKPRKIFEIGSGFSTYLMDQAVLKNREEGYDCELIAIDPYPNKL